MLNLLSIAGVSANSHNNEFILRIHDLKKFQEQYPELNVQGIVKKSNLKFKTLTTEKQRKLKQIQKKFNLDNIYKVQVINSELIEALKQDPNIESLEKNFRIQASFNDPFFISHGEYWQRQYSESWNIEAVHASKAWDQGYTGKGVVVAVIDSGVDYNHPDIWDNIWVNPKLVDDINSDGKISLDDIDLNHNHFIEADEIHDDVIGKDFTEFNDNNPLDEAGHGTHVAGIIAATGNNARGIIGVAPEAKILPIRFLDAEGGGYYSDLLEALNYLQLLIVEQDIEHLVINNSYGANSAALPRYLEDNYDALNELGAINVVSAGNNSRKAAKMNPASFANVITVAASNPHGRLAGFSNFGSSVDIAAPGAGTTTDEKNLGGGILSLDLYTNNPNGERYKTMSGTSMAAPHVAAAIAILLEKNPNLSLSEIKSILQLNSHKITSTKYAGSGILDIEAAINNTETELRAQIQKIQTNSLGEISIQADIQGSLYKLEYCEKHWANPKNPQITWKTLAINSNTISSNNHNIYYSKSNPIRNLKQVTLRLSSYDAQGKALTDYVEI